MAVNHGVGIPCHMLRLAVTICAATSGAPPAPPRPSVGGLFPLTIFRFRFGDPHLTKLLVFGICRAGERVSDAGWPSSCCCCFFCWAILSPPALCCLRPSVQSRGVPGCTARCCCCAAAFVERSGGFRIALALANKPSSTDPDLPSGDLVYRTPTASRPARTPSKIADTYNGRQLRRS
jgi:hypothetical protein